MKIISWKLWLPYHAFPVVPFIPLAPFVQIILLVLFFIISILLFIKPVNRYLLLALIIIEVISMMGDEIRWQPWLYQFLFIAFAVFINPKKPQLAINSIILIVASGYFFSGLQKINSGFLQNIWLQLVLVRFLHFSPTVYSSRVLRYLGLIVPFIEIITGILLLLPKQNKLYAWLPISLHFFILNFLSPWGINYNFIVLPWNMMLAGFVYMLYIKTQNHFSFKEAFYKGNIVIAFAWLLLPIAGLSGYWERFFSFSVYSGNTPHLTVYLPNNSSVLCELQSHVHYSKKGFQGMYYYINVTDWSLSELQVPVPPELRIYKAVENSFQKKYGYLQPLFRYQ